MKKEIVEQYRWCLCLLLLVWISKSSIAYSQDESTENFNVSESAEDDAPEKYNVLDERRQVLKRILHEQLEHVTHAEQTVGHHGKERDSKPTQSDEEETEEEEEGEGEERVYNPWQDSFQDQYEDGTYVYGFSLPNGVTRYERKFFSDEYKGPVVEGFYTQPRFFGKRTLYELRCYRADYYRGYEALKVQYLRRPPIVRRDKEPNVDCLHKH